MTTMAQGTPIAHNRAIMQIGELQTLFPNLNDSALNEPEDGRTRKSLLFNFGQIIRHLLSSYIERWFPIRNLRGNKNEIFAWGLKTMRIFVMLNNLQHQNKVSLDIFDMHIQLRYVEYVYQHQVNYYWISEKKNCIENCSYSFTFAMFLSTKFAIL